MTFPLSYKSPAQTSLSPIKNPDHINNGVLKIEMDGENFPVNQPLPVKPGEPISVVVTMGQ